MDRAAPGRALARASRALLAGIGLLLPTGCPLLVGLDNDYASGDGGVMLGPDGSMSDARLDAGPYNFCKSNPELCASNPDSGMTSMDATCKSNPAACGFHPDGAMMLPDGAMTPPDAHHPGDSGDAACPTCGACTAGEVACNGDQPQKCDTNGVWQDNGSACGGGKACCLGSCQASNAPACWVTLASGQKGANALAVDDTSVYWTTSGDPTPPDSGAAPGIVMKIALAGGTPVTLASGSATPYGIAVDTSYVYWTSNPITGEGAVLSVPLAGGTPTTLAPAQPEPFGIAVNSASIFWTDNEGGKVMAEMIGTLNPSPIAPSFEANEAPTAIAVVDGNVYWIDGGWGRVMALKGGMEITLAAGGGAKQVAADSAFVYWTNVVDGSNDTIMKIVPTGSGTPITVASGQSNPRGIAVNGTDVYWANSLLATGSIVKTSLDGGAPITIASGQDVPLSVVVDDTSVYWTSFRGGTVMKAPK